MLGKLKNGIFALPRLAFSAGQGTIRLGGAVWHAPGVRILTVELSRWTLRLGYLFMRAYWFLFQPQTRAVKCIVSHGGKILLVRNTYGPSGWTLPGGGVHRNEAIDAAAMREVKEETGCDLGEAFEMGRIFNDAYRKQETIHFLYGEADSADIKLDPVEITEAGWFPPLHLPYPTRFDVMTGVQLWQRFLLRHTLTLKDKLADPEKGSEEAR